MKVKVIKTETVDVKSQDIVDSLRKQLMIEDLKIIDGQLMQRSRYDHEPDYNLYLTSTPDIYIKRIKLMEGLVEQLNAVKNPHLEGDIL